MKKNRILFSPMLIKWKGRTAYMNKYRNIHFHNRLYWSMWLASGYRVSAEMQNCYHYIYYRFRIGLCSRHLDESLTNWMSMKNETRSTKSADQIMYGTLYSVAPFVTLQNFQKNKKMNLKKKSPLSSALSSELEIPRKVIINFEKSVATE